MIKFHFVKVLNTNLYVYADDMCILYTSYSGLIFLPHTHWRGERVLMCVCVCVRAYACACVQVFFKPHKFHNYTDIVIPREKILVLRLYTRIHASWWWWWSSLYTSNVYVLIIVFIEKNIENHEFPIKKYSQLPPTCTSHNTCLLSYLIDIEFFFFSCGNEYVECMPFNLLFVLSCHH